MIFSMCTARLCFGLRWTVLTTAALVSAAAQDSRSLNLHEYVHTAPNPSDRFPASWYPADQSAGMNETPGPVTGLPYTAISVETSRSKSAHGEVSENVTRNPQARDSLGRTRSESKNGGLGLADGSFVETYEVIVSDPVSHCNFFWTEARPNPPDNDSHVANVTCAPQTLKYADGLTMVKVIEETPVGGTKHGDTDTLVERLPPLHIDGITVERQRVTNTYTGQPGKPTTSVSENWYSPDLNEVIRLGESDGTGIMLTDIRRVEPDPKLFYPPAGYRIQVTHGAAR